MSSFTFTYTYFTIYKSHYVSKQKENHINVLQLFKIELKNRFELDKLVNCHTNVFVTLPNMSSFTFTYTYIHIHSYIYTHTYTSS
jgi:hypothetical protein